MIICRTGTQRLQDNAWWDNWHEVTAFETSDLVEAKKGAYELLNSSPHEISRAWVETR